MLNCSFSEVVDLQQVRELLEAHHKLTGMTYAILDPDDNTLIAAGWQDICTRFHRIHPTTCARCHESDAYIKAHLNDSPNQLLEYRCKNGLVDIAIPIVICGQHQATFFTGQFFYEDDPPSREFFISQAQKMGFDQEQYLAALDRVPQYSREHVHGFLLCMHSIVRSLATVGMKNLQLSVEMKERRRAEEALHRRNRDLRAINTCNQVLMRAEDEQNLLREVCRIICDESGYRMAWVGYAQHNEERSVVPVAWSGSEDGYLSQAKITWNKTERWYNPTGNAIRLGQSICLQDFTVEGQGAPWHEKALQRGYRSSISLPLKDNLSGVFGAITIYSTEPNAFTADEVWLMERLAGDLAFGITALRTRKQRNRAEYLLNGQKKVLELVATGAPLTTSLEALVKMIELQSAGMLASILLLDKDGVHLRHGAAPSLPLAYTTAIDGVAIGPSVGSCGTAAFRKKAVFVEDIATDPLWQNYKELALLHNLHACWSTPIFDANQNVLGTFAMYYDHPNLPQSEDHHLIQIATQTAAISIGNYQTRVELQESGERLRLAVQASNVGLWDWNLKTSKIVFSPEWKGQLGYQTHEIGNEFTEWENRIASEDRERVLTRLQSCLDGGNPEYVVECRLRHKDSSYRWFYIRGELLRDDHGAPLRLMGCQVDITELKRAEEIQHRLNRELRAISDCNQILIRTTEESIILREVCRIVCEEAGYSMAWVGYADQDEHKTLRPVAWGGNESGFLSLGLRTWADTEEGHLPCSDAIRLGKTICAQEMTAIPSTNPWRERALQRGYRSSISLPLKDESSHVFGVFVIYSEVPNAFTSEEVRLLEELAGDLGFGITSIRARNERKVAEAALRESEAKYRLIVDTATEGIWMIGTDLRTLFVNTRMASMLGYSVDDILGRPINDFLFEDDLSDHEKRIANRRKGISENYERRYRHKDGSAVWTWCSVAPLQDENHNFLGALAMMTDITRRKQAEEEKERLRQHLQQSQKMEAIGQLAGGIAHDFNNVLGVINGYSENLLLNPETPACSRDQIEEILAAGQRAAALTRRLLAFSRKLVLQPKIVSLNTIIEDLYKMLRRLIGEEIEVKTILDPRLNAVKADPSQMEQVLINFCINARDAMPAGGTLTIQTSNIDMDEQLAAKHFPLSPGSYVCVSVTDTGIGMSKETLSHIFEPFFTTKGADRGTGLGLATVFGIVKQSGGQVWAESSLGSGSTFSVYLPTAQAAVEARTRETGCEEITRGSATILLVEDLAPLRTLFRKIVEGNGYTVLEAEDGEQAEQIAKQHEGKISLLLTDVSLPKTRGPELATKLVAQNKGMKVLFMSGHSDTIIAPEGKLQAGTAFIQKPFSAEDLLKKIQEVMNAGLSENAEEHTRRAS